MRMGGNLTMEFEVFGFAEAAFDLVAVGEGGREPGGDFGHI